MDTAPAYRALALQARCRAVNKAAGHDEARAMMRETLARLAEQVRASVAFIGRDCKLVVLPEYFLTGHPVGDPIPAWRDKAAIDPDGAEYDALAAIAHDNGIFLSGNVYGRDPNFAALYFQTSFVIDPGGKAVLRYRRINSVMTPSPHDVLDRYLELYGIDGLLPVARTEIGTLACIASDEILFPELARALALRGAEVFLHSSSEVGSPLVTVKDVAKRARALENLAYVVSANSGGIHGSPIPGASTDGGSQIVDFEGRVLVEAGPGESMVAFAELDLGVSRRARRRPGMGNLLARQRLDAYASIYANTVIHRPNQLADGTATPMDAHRAALQRLIDEGIAQ
ncbi:MAG: nitrilase-related carbon-nitrogen hydrolase [Actinomycetota bacterium]